MTRGLASYWKNSFFHSLLRLHMPDNSADFKVSEETWHSAEIILMLQLNQDSIGIWIWFSNTIPLLLYLRVQILVSISTFKDRCWLVTYHERTLLSSWLKYQAEKFLFIFLTQQKKRKSFSICIVQNTHFPRNLNFLCSDFTLHVSPSQLLFLTVDIDWILNYFFKE